MEVAKGYTDAATKVGDTGITELLQLHKHASVANLVLSLYEKGKTDSSHDRRMPPYLGLRGVC